MAHYWCRTLSGPKKSQPDTPLMVVLEVVAEVVVALLALVVLPLPETLSPIRQQSNHDVVMVVDPEAVSEGPAISWVHPMPEPEPASMGPTVS